MNKNTLEVLDILQEECAEAIVAISKIKRFGFSTPKYNSTGTNLQHLEQELGDIQCMIDILQEMDIISYTSIEQAAERKREKLKIWSNIFKQEEKQT